MDDLNHNEILKSDPEKVKLTRKDIAAIMIAQFEIIIPIALISCVSMWLIILFLMKVWLKV